MGKKNNKSAVEKYRERMDRKIREIEDSLRNICNGYKIDSKSILEKNYLLEIEVRELKLEIESKNKAIKKMLENSELTTEEVEELITNERRRANSTKAFEGLMNNLIGDASVRSGGLLNIFRGGY